MATRGFRICVLCVSVAAAGAGCATSPEVKKASTQMTAALTAMDQAKLDFKKVLLAEIDATRDQVARTMVARAVRQRLDETAARLGEEGDLVGLSDQIDAVAQEIGQVAATFEKVTIKPAPSHDEIDAAITDVLDKRVKDLDKAIELLKDSPGVVAQLRRSREVSLSWGQPGSVVRLDLETFVRLAGIRATVSDVLLVQLENHLQALRQVQAVADSWIQTDVTVDGKQVADVVIQAKKLTEKGQ
jgi:hypothetical protein